MQTHCSDLAHSTGLGTDETVPRRSLPSGQFRLSPLTFPCYIYAARSGLSNSFERGANGISPVIRRAFRPNVTY